MAKYFQYIQTDQRGVITQLDYIDDVTFPGKELYVFKDGFKCYSELIAHPQNIKAFEEGNYVMAELYSPYNKWVFEETHLGPEEKKDVNEEGQQVIGADPYFIKRGPDDTAELLHKPSIRVKATPPHPGAVLPLESADGYRMSARFTKNKQETKQIPQSAAQKPVVVEKEVVAEETPVEVSEPKQEDTLKINGAFYHIANTKGCLEDEQKNATIFGNTATFDEWGQVFGYLLKEFKRSELRSKENTDTDTEKRNEDEQNKALRNLVESCQTAPTSVDLKLKINLPVPEFFKLVQMSYGPESMEGVVGMIVDDIPLDVIRKTITDYLIKKFSTVMNTPIFPAEVEIPELK